MSPSSALTQSARDTIYLVRFIYGARTVDKPLGVLEERYTDSPGAQPGPGGTYAVTSALELKIPKNTGELKAKDATVTIPYNTFSRYLSDGGAHSPVHCYIYEWHKPATGNAENKLLCKFSGPVLRATQAPKSKSGLVEVVATPQKRTWDVPLGLLEEHDCIWPLYSGPCSVIKTSFDVPNVEVLTVGDHSITVESTSAIENKEDGWFSRGWAEYQGCLIDIRVWHAHTPLTFHLVRQASPSWVNKLITVYAGCDKQLATCRRRFDKESQHGGFGVGIPPYHPMLERSGIHG